MRKKIPAAGLGFYSAVLISTFAFLSCGCELPGVLLHVANLDPPVPAQFVPPKEPTLVLVENYRSPDAMRLDGDQIAHQVGEELKKDAKLDIVDSDKLQEMREDDAEAYRKMKIVDIGKATGANTVIYVDLLESEVIPDPTAGAVNAIATARIKVVDVKTGNTLWPADGSHGKEISETKDFNQYDPQRAVVMHTQMLTSLSSKISKLFYAWKADDSEQENAGG